ncbi:hypothetical protein DNTS_035228 [Danionella cerebrum]|uniref:Uncharacterized protein n=1 Tax=Danionella cerebrum TaxID=2873325 RepID=A0A553N2Z2_9TELE|nr:hypothetical protein DNTS_035228 [Danionella translucida]
MTSWGHPPVPPRHPHALAYAAVLRTGVYLTYRKPSVIFNSPPKPNTCGLSMNCLSKIKHDDFKLCPRFVSILVGSWNTMTASTAHSLSRLLVVYLGSKGNDLVCGMPQLINTEGEPGGCCWHADEKNSNGQMVIHKQPEVRREANNSSRHCGQIIFQWKEEEAQIQGKLPMKRASGQIPANVKEAERHMQPLRTSSKYKNSRLASVTKRWIRLGNSILLHVQPSVDKCFITQVVLMKALLKKTSKDLFVSPNDFNLIKCKSFPRQANVCLEHDITDENLSSRSTVTSNRVQTSKNNDFHRQNKQTKKNRSTGKILLITWTQTTFETFSKETCPPFTSYYSTKYLSNIKNSKRGNKGSAAAESSSFVSSHRVVEHHILFSQLQQHRVVEELADTDILAQTLEEENRDDHDDTRHHQTSDDTRGTSSMAYFTPAGFDHELSGQMRGRLRLERTNHNALIQRITRNNLE